jgi:hypothetical protein
MLMVVATSIPGPGAASAPAPTSAVQDEAMVFLLAGQSNMVGRGRGADLPAEYKMQPKNVLFYLDGALRGLAPAGGSEEKANAAYFGPEISFGHEMARAFPDRTIILVKRAVVGTAISSGWDPEKKGGLRDRLLADYQAAVKGRKSRPVAVLWSQGGADAKREEDAKAYVAGLKSLIERIRKDLEAPKLPFLFSGSRPEDPITEGMAKRFPYLKTVRAAYVEIDRTVPGARMVSTVGLTYNSDGIHVDAPGQIEFGKRFARVYLEMVTSKPAAAGGPASQAVK